MNEQDPQELQALRETSAHVAARTDILDVRFESVSAELTQQPLRRLPYEYDLDRDVRVDIADAETFIVRATYTVTIHQLVEADDAAAVSPSNADDTAATEGKREIARLSARVAGLFQVDHDRMEETAIDESDIEAYAKSTGLFALHPYARQCLRDLTDRLSLPPLTIGVLRIATGELPK